MVEDLPIRKYASDIVAAVKANNVVVVIGETGSGKTTQISQILLEAGLAGKGIIGVTQPRRVGAVTVAKRVAEECGVELGTLVGYAVRFEDCSSRDTKIKYLTDGTLLRECLEDPMLAHYEVLILDEAHERSLNTDILFGVIKGLLTRRPQLKLVITSATLDGEKFSAYFNECPVRAHRAVVFNVPGRCFPVDIIHAKEDHQKDYCAAAIDTVLQIHTDMPTGDILVFLTGQAEIDKAIVRLNDAVAALPAGSCGSLMVLPMYASLPPDMQLRVFRPGPPGVRRCVLATNVAETSVTVEGVAYVVDTGVVKQKSYNPRTGMDSLDVVAISRVQATQRAGRAGRTRAGKCFRLYTKAFFESQMSVATQPEIQRTSLVGCVLYLKSLNLEGVDVLHFDFLDAPAPGALADALRQLYVLGALDADGAITSVGQRMALLPLDPSLSRALLCAQELGCLREVMSVSAMLSTEHVFSGGHGPGDFDRAASGQESSGSGRHAGGGGGGGGRRGGGGEGGAAAKLKGLLSEGLGDHVLLLRLWEVWERSGCSRNVCDEYGLDLRGMNFARDIRRQLQSVVGEDGSGLDKLQAGDAPTGRTTNASKHSGGGGGDAVATRGAAVSGSKRSRNEEDERPLDRHQRGGTGGSAGGRQAAASGRTVDAMRHALTIGFANKLARRLRTHNGYRTLNAVGQLAQPHPSCAEMAPDEDGLLPEWIIYHELVATSRPYLRQVCPTRAQWVEPLLPRILEVDVARLSGGKGASSGAAVQVVKLEGSGAAAAASGGGEEAHHAVIRRNDSDAVGAARARFLARKQQQAQGGR